VEKLQPARLEFAPDGTPFSASYGDVYHSAHGGPEQARHVFIAGNDLPQRWQGKDRFVILETGFGLGLNFLASWQAWKNDAQRCRRLHFVSFEKHPFTAADLAIAQQAWPEFAEFAAELQQHWPLLTPGVHRLHLDGGNVILTLFFGDATQQLRTVNAAVDAFFLDGFSPAKNPELWTPQLCKALARLSSEGTTLATWSVAGHVRQALIEAEFDLEKRPGFAGKRQMLSGRFRSRRPNRHQPPAERRAIVIGAGIAGSATAYALAAAGWRVTVLEQAATPATGASSNLAGMLRPLPSVDDNRISRLTRAGFFATRARLAALAAFPERIELRCGTTVDRLERVDNQWQAIDAAGKVIAAAPILIMASGATATRFTQFAWLPQRPARGQVSHLPATATPALEIVVCRQGGYAMPEVDGLRLIGATSQLDDAEPAERLADHVENLQKLAFNLPGFAAAIAPATLHGRVGFRPMSPDRLPIVGPVPEPQFAGAPRLRALPRQPGLWCMQGFGARGIVWSMLMADLLLSQLEGEPLPLENDLVDALDPGRFLLGKPPVRTFSK